MLQVSICTCVLFLASTGTAKVKLSIAPQSGYIELGDTKGFICKVDGGEVDDFHWYRPNGEEIEEGEDADFSVKHSEYDSHLHIKEAQTAVDGTYTCEAQADDDEQITSNIRVKVIQKAIFKDVNLIQEFDEGTDAAVQCDVVGIPTPTVSWTKDGNDVAQKANGLIGSKSRNYLWIPDIKASDAGEYQCVSKISERNEINNITIVVTVKYRPRFVSADPGPLYTWLGNPINVSCPIESLPKATITWTRDDLEFRGELNTFTVDNAPELTSILEVTVNGEADFAAYTCVASNELGNVTRTILVKEGDVPTAPQNMTAVPHSTTVRVFMDQPANNGGIPVLGYHLEWKKNTSTEWATSRTESGTSLVSGLEPYTSYQFRAAAVNGKGLGSYSDPVTVSTLSIREPDSPTVSARSLNEGNSFRIYFDDEESGGSPITQYNIKYKEEEAKRWINDSVNGTNSYLLQDLKWATTYNVQVKAENQIDQSLPTFLDFSTPQKPSPPATANSATGDKAKVGTGGIIGIIMVIFLVLLIAVDVSCYYTNRCGMLMCIAVNLLGKQEPAAKRLDQETGLVRVSRNELNPGIKEVRSGEPTWESNGAKRSGASTDKVALTRTVSAQDKDPPGTVTPNYR
ncbi:neural cell adhesion molecule 1 isoform X1 [Heptranchias perlo]|uniref:neural cell adhesion molecule 1 isoform X1 n=1 Tax=Heptranchias perlo TaxID=212740 RepID=UPI0035599E63